MYRQIRILKMEDLCKTINDCLNTPVQFDEVFE